jgi:hypothetical protein
VGAVGTDGAGPRRFSIKGKDFSDSNPIIRPIINENARFMHIFGLKSCMIPPKISEAAE